MSTINPIQALVLPQGINSNEEINKTAIEYYMLNFRPIWGSRQPPQTSFLITWSNPDGLFRRANGPSINLKSTNQLPLIVYELQPGESESSEKSEKRGFLVGPGNPENDTDPDGAKERGWCRSTRIWIR